MQKADEINLNDSGLKKTTSRLAIIDILEKQKIPADVPTILKELRLKKILTNQVTVYRILNNFLEKGIINRIELHEGKFRFELARRKHHHHLVCQNCGKIEDVEDSLIQKLEKQITMKKKFMVKDHSLEFFGLCASCQQKD